MATSYNGWTAHPDRNVIGVVQHPVYSGGLKAGDVTTVLQYVADQLAARVEPVIPDHCWGYAYKLNANNASQLSCHASGTAIDFNAPAHPNGKSGTFTAAQVKTIKAILAECDGAVGWLEGYDEMHFEIRGGPAKVAQVAAKLRGATPPAGKPPTATTPPPAQEWDEMATKAEVKAAMTEALAEYMPRALSALLTGKPNGAVPAGSSSVLLDGVGTQGWATKGVHAARTGKPNAQYPDPGKPKD